MRAALLLAVLLLVAGVASSGARTVATLPAPVAGAAGVVLDGIVYAVGGHEVNDHSAAVFAFDPTTNETRIAGSLPAARDLPVAWAWGGKILIAGGAERIAATPPLPTLRSLGDILEFDPATNTTRVTADALPSPRHGAALAVVGAKAYILGGVGVSGSTTTQHAEIVVYDAALPEGSRVSTHATRLPGGVRDARALVAPDGNILLVGGRIQSASGAWACGAGITLCPTANVARVDLAAGTTSILGTLFAPMTSAEVGILGGAAYVVGGVGTNVGPRFNVTRIDLATFALDEVGVVENSTGAAAASVVDDVLHLLGGRAASNAAPVASVRAYVAPAPPEAVAPAPTSLAATLTPREGRAAWSLHLTWSGPSATYEVESGSSPDALVAVATLQGTDWSGARVLPGTTTWWSVRQVVDGAWGESALPISLVAPPLPRAPGWLTANATDVAIDLAWESVAGPNETYAVWRDDVVLAENVTGASYHDADVGPDRAYVYVVTTEGALRSVDSPDARASLSAEQEEPPTPTVASLTPPAPSPTPAATPTPAPSTPPVDASPSPSAPDAPTPSPPVAASPTPGIGVLALVSVCAAVAWRRRVA